ncbi:hypothetical protein BKA67DRAFT_566634 [Truncatella angustata]|uniref:Uncharacterized protein n=1 Tax=Truncatella angustata TaxID=152316 RepID=A0A9P8ZZC8_9PEZI|nr:uncharacterized protein BKA67DRAFT_566634 [Truncatella angustata]KAH6654921.1 hypothetical protein BKA67DRAFT_566634 [Truncatella angustata]
MIVYTYVGDGVTPECGNCAKLQLRCEQPTVDYRFLIHTNNANNAKGYSPSSVASPRREQALFPQSRGDPSGSTALRLRQAANLSRQSPRLSLEEPIIALIFSHYIKIIAPWYDLTDATNTFNDVVTARALDFPILFRAIIAMSSSHWFKTTGHAQEIAFAFYAACVEDLLQALANSSNFQGEYLAAACLLQLYEILNEDDMPNPHCHLSGAYSFSTAVAIDFSTWDLSQAGFWNYMREEITVGLASSRNRMVRIGKDFRQLRDMMTSKGIGDDMRANLITYILAEALNLYCAFEEYEDAEEQPERGDDLNTTWKRLSSDLEQWTENLPATFQPYSTAPKPGNVFPSAWMQRPWHVCALQYAAIAKILLILSAPQDGFDGNRRREEEIQFLTTNVCGLAYTTGDLSAALNSFGPLIFCGQFLTMKHHRAALETMLNSYSQSTGYPINCRVKQLRDRWAR